MKTLKDILTESERKPKGGDFKSLLPDNYWNDERLAKLEKNYNAGMSRKEMVMSDFPEANPRHIETALKKYKDRLNLRTGKITNPLGVRQFNAFWTPKNKQTLRRAWRSGEDLQTMHGKYFEGISFQALRKATRILRKDLDLKPRKTPHRQPENLVSPIEKRDEAHIINDLKKGRSIERVAFDHYADPDAVKRLSTRELGPTKKYRTVRPYEDIPQHHIDYANELRLKHPTEIDPNVKSKGVGRALIARSLNNKFSHEEGFIPYDVGHVDYMIRRGLISTPGRERAIKAPSEIGLAHENRRKSIWAAHSSGTSVADIASNHGIPPSRVQDIIQGIQRRKDFAKPQNINIKENYSKGIEEMTDLTQRVINLIMEAKGEEFDTPQQRAMRRETQNYKKLHKDLMRIRKIMNGHLMRLDPTSPVAKIAQRYHKMASNDAEEIFPTPKEDKSKTIKEAMAMARKRIEEAKEKPSVPPTGTGSAAPLTKRSYAIVSKSGGKEQTIMTATRGKGKSSGRAKEGRKISREMTGTISGYKRPGTYKTNA